jgi:cell division protein FtsQ
VRRRGGGRPPSPRSRWRTAFFGLAGAAIVAGVAWALLGNRLLVVRSVAVTGTHLVTPAQVLAAADVPVGTPLLSVDAGAVTRRVETIRDVASATVSKQWPDHLVIAVTERVPVMALKMAGGGYDQLDASGVIVRWAKVKPAALPLLVSAVPGGALRGSPAVTAAASVLGELQPWLASQVAEVRPAPVAAGPEQVMLTLRDGKTVQWGSTGDAAQKDRELAALLPGGARHIDVSAPGTVVTRLFPPAASAAADANNGALSVPIAVAQGLNRQAASRP